MKPMLVTHLGLGDAIVCAGLAVELSRKHNGLIFPCWKHNEVSVRSFFINHPEISILPIENEIELLWPPKEHQIRCGHYSGQPALENEGFDAWIYRTAGVDIEHRWASDPIAKASLNVEQADISSYYAPLVFVHEDQKRGFGINWLIYPPNEFQTYHPKHIYKDLNSNSILCYASVLSKAYQIHVINSSFLHLSESLLTNTEKLFFHRYARPCARVDQAYLRKQWEVLDSPEKQLQSKHNHNPEIYL